ncbi:hypothetical protein SP28804_A0004, partial [Streptococcus pneumoniae CDC0288-04]
MLSPDFLIFSLTLFIYFSPFSVSPILSNLFHLLQ